MIFPKNHEILMYVIILIFPLVVQIISSDVAYIIKVGNTELGEKNTSRLSAEYLLFTAKRNRK